MKESSGCLVFIFICLLIGIIIFGFNFLLTKVIIWLVAQLFNIDWSDKTLAVFIAVTLLTSINIKITKK